MSISVQNNSSALLALQNLNRTNDQLSQVQDEISSTLKIAEAKDNPAVWATAQGQSSDVDTLQSVTNSLNRATSITDVASSAGQSVLDMLTKMRQDVLAAQDNTLNSSDRAALNSDFTQVLSRITTTLQSADFDGANLLDGSGGNLRFLTSADSTQMMTLTAQNMSVGGSIITLSATASIPTAQTASAMLAQMDASIANVTTAMTKIGAQAKLVSSHGTLVQALSTLLQTGQTSLIGADTDADSASLAALKVQQQLSEQSLNIANSMPSVLLSLFK